MSRWRAVDRWVNHADGLAAMPLALGERSGHAAVERLDGGIEDGACRIEMVRAKGVRVAR